MEISFVYAGLNHLNWLRSNDQRIGIEILKKKVADKQIILATTEKRHVGWLRFSFFWDEIPFMNLLYFLEDYRHQGIGKLLVSFWEKEMKKQNHHLVMTSSLSNEPAQHFYRKLGYQDAGALLLPGEALEIIFTKALS